MPELKNMAKQILNFDLIEVVVENGRIEDSVIEIMVARFPYLVRDIFKELDDQTLTNCRNVSRLFCDHIDNNKFYWFRKIQRYRKNVGVTYPHWNKVLKNIPVEIVKELSVSTQQFFKDDESRSDLHWSPLEIGKFALGTFVSFVTTVLLTSMISLKIGFKGITPSNINYRLTK